MKSELQMAVAASQVACTLAEKSSSFKNTCFLTNELTINCKLKILPAKYGLNKAYFVATNISGSFHFLLSPLHFTQKCKLTLAAAAGN